MWAYSRRWAKLAVAKPPPAMERIYFEDMVPGRETRLGEFTLSAEEIIDFASKYDPQPFHLDEASGAKTHFGGLVASGWHTCAATMRVMVDSYLSKTISLGSPGLDEVRWLKPVRPGDVLTVMRLDKESRPSKSKPDRGSVLSETYVVNQHGERVMHMLGWGMFGRRPVEKSM
jgi:acyl dehydratase